MREHCQSRKSLPRRKGWKRFTDDSLDAVAYYLRATRKREERGLPCNGVSMDRRQLSLVADAMHSDNIKSYMCLCCAQIHTWVRNWECAYDCFDDEAKPKVALLCEAHGHLHDERGEKPLANVRNRS